MSLRLVAALVASYTAVAMRSRETHDGVQHCLVKKSGDAKPSESYQCLEQVRGEDRSFLNEYCGQYSFGISVGSCGDAGFSCVMRPHPVPDLPPDATEKDVATHKLLKDKDLRFMMDPTSSQVIKIHGGVCIYKQQTSLDWLTD
mmetsp:Transcript_36044/g.67118  ORF Transcript_36044/g.67118 Transcript_36044/m.67118 type:complete len:144 (+) Transcript_36044:86-517(+)